MSSKIDFSYLNQETKLFNYREKQKLTFEKEPEAPPKQDKPAEEEKKEEKKEEEKKEEKKEEQKKTEEEIKKQEELHLKEDPKIKELMHDLDILAENKIPLDGKGNKPDSLLFQIDNINHLNRVIESLEKNNTFKGNLEIISNKFNDNLGLKIAEIIKNNSLQSLTIWNKTKPFSDRVAVAIGEALAKNTVLKNFVCFLDVGENSPVYLCKFLSCSSSALEKFGYLKLTKKLLETLSEFMSKTSKLKILNFYYEPLTEVNLLYKNEITQDVFEKLAYRIENSSQIIDMNIIPREEKFDEEINKALTQNIADLNKSLKFYCKIIEKKKKDQENYEIEKVFKEKNNIIDRILETIDRKEGKEKKNSIVAVRSYLDRAIGESLNQAFYNLEVQKERNPEKKELFTAKGSLRFIAQNLLNNKQ